MFAFEAIFAPAEHCLKAPRPPFAHELDRKKLAESAVARSTSDYELLRTGKLTDFTEANAHLRDILQRVRKSSTSSS